MYIRLSKMTIFRFAACCCFFRVVLRCFTSTKQGTRILRSDDKNGNNNAISFHFIRNLFQDENQNRNHTHSKLIHTKSPNSGEHELSLDKKKWRTNRFSSEISFSCCVFPKQCTQADLFALRSYDFAFIIKLYFTEYSPN